MKKLLGAVGLLTVVVPISLRVVACDNWEKQAKIINQEDIVKVINAIEYKKLVLVNSKVDDLIKVINSEFIQDKLTGAIKNAFNKAAIHIDAITVNRQKIVDDDLLEHKIIHAEINYNYGKIKAIQKTRLTITVKHPITDLTNLLKDYSFIDILHVKGFANSKEDIIKDLKDHILVPKGIKLENEVEFDGSILNKIIVKAKEKAILFKGQFEYHYKLKLIQLHGSVDKSMNKINPTNGNLKLYMYLNDDGKVKMHNVFTNLLGYDGIMNLNFRKIEHLKIIINNKNLSILGDSKLSDVVKKFNDLNIALDNLDTSLVISFNAKEPSKIKWFEDGQIKKFSDDVKNGKLVISKQGVKRVTETSN